MKDLLIGTLIERAKEYRIDISEVQVFKINPKFFFSPKNSFLIGGFFRLIEGDMKLLQDVLKIFSTPKGASYYAKEYGTNLHSYIGKKITHVLLAQIKEEILNTLRTLNSFKKDNPVEEQVDYIEKLKFFPSEEEGILKGIKVQFVLYSKAGRPIQVEIRV
jgi:hypothetical protein